MEPTHICTGDTPADSEEIRHGAEGNAVESSATGTQGLSNASNGLDRIREAARQDSTLRFTSLLHHITVEFLDASYRMLRHDASVGIDDETWDSYGTNLSERLRDLHERLHSGAYRALASKRVWIPKPDGGQRPIGIASLEDKIVQKALVRILEQIYEVDFLGFSYGYRPEMKAHDALDSVYVMIARRKVNWILDADIKSFFDTVDHTWLMKFLEHRIGDRRVLRLIRKFLRAGVSEAGQWSKTEVGTPQGGVLSPLLANIYLHYVLDLWIERWRTTRARGDVYIVRYADDFVVGFQYRDDAEKLERELGQRLGAFGLQLHPEKTRLIEFGRFANENRRRRGKGKAETFTFLGMTHYCTVCRTRKKFMLGRKTSGKKLRAKLKEIAQELRRKRHAPTKKVGAWLRQVVNGHMQYFAVPGNTYAVSTFRAKVVRLWLKSLRRRSQRGRKLTWARYKKLIDAYFPEVRVLHPYPTERFGVIPKAGAV
jgi:RNA-directed DNA polymerase